MVTTLTSSFLARLFCLILSVVFLWSTPAIASEPSDLPELNEIEPNTWVIDFANALSPYTETQVNQKLAQLNANTQAAVRFVTVQRIDFGQPVQEFAQQLFDRWFPEDAANQTLVLIATEDRRSAIVQGEQAKSLVTEPIAQSIASETVFFPTQKAEFNKAVTDGSDRLIAVLSGQPDPGAPVIYVAPEVEVAPAKPEDPVATGLWVIGLLVLATVIPMVTYFILGKPS
ncbi:MAG: TPM domain-containing protein [Pseudanabaenaceae cyanobacterium bins.68]|nr:TPM domain-containing protein [Pseudanabaenaceae cyanobacterium bins.68]